MRHRRWRAGLANLIALEATCGEEARDFPLYCQRLSLFPEVPEHETIAELFLPLK